MELGLTGRLGGECVKVEEFEIEGVRDWVVRSSRGRKGESSVAPRFPIKGGCR